MKISISQYAKTLMELTDGKSEQEILDIVKKFAEALKKDGQLKIAGKIMKKYGEIYNAKNGIVVAEITVSRKPESLKVKEVGEFLKKKYDAKDVEMKTIVDESIGGGIVIRVGDEVMDGSIANQLKKLKNILSK